MPLSLMWAERLPLGESYIYSVASALYAKKRTNLEEASGVGLTLCVGVHLYAEHMLTGKRTYSRGRQRRIANPIHAAKAVSGCVTACLTRGRGHGPLGHMLMPYVAVCFIAGNG